MNENQTKDQTPAPGVGGKTAGPQPIRYINPDIPRFDLPQNRGECYDARVPDTLDLHERAALAINGLTGCVDPGADYEIYWKVEIKGDRPVMFRDINHQVQLIMQRAVPLMRRMSGSTEKREVERRWLEVLLHLRGPDNLFYYPLQGRPWIKYYKDAAGQYDDFQGDQYTGPLNNAWTLELLGLYYRLTGDPQFKEMGEKLADAMIAHFVHREDYAFEPKGNYGPGEKPPSDAPIPDNWYKNALMGWPAYGTVQFYRATGYRPALEFSGKLARFTCKHSGMFDAEGRWLATRHGAWHTAPLFGILEYALEAGDREMIDFVRKSYEYAKAPGQHMELLTGFTPEAAEPEGQTGEICEVAFMLNLAVRLSAAGVGDYWDDVDRWTRNHFAEGQLTRSEWMNRTAAGQPKPAIDPVHESDDNVACKCLGAFAGWPYLNDFHGGSHYFGPGAIFMHCCVGEGSAALYRVWENILRFQDGKLRVNLLLNRASRWTDVDSHLPYRGQVDVKIKQDLDLEIRLAEWVKPEEARCTVDGAPRDLSFDGRYARVGAVKAGQKVTLTFPISERTDKVLVQGKQYTLIRRGNDVVHIDPPGKDDPLYQRSHYRQNETQWRTVRRFVPAQEIPW